MRLLPKARVDFGITTNDSYTFIWREHLLVKIVFYTLMAIKCVSCCIDLYVAYVPIVSI